MAVIIGKEIQKNEHVSKRVAAGDSQKKKNFSFWKAILAFLVILVIGEGFVYLFLKKKSSVPSTSIKVVQEEKAEQQEELRFFCPVPQEYCRNFEAIADPFAGILVPEGTEIFAALTGRVSIMSDGVGNIVVEIMSLSNEKPAEKFFYYFDPSADLLINKGEEVEKGKPIAKVSQEKVGGFLESYSLVVSATDGSANYYPDPTLLFSE